MKMKMGLWIVAITAVSVFFAAACSSAPNAGGEPVQELTITGMDVGPDHPDGLSGRTPRFGRITAPDGTSAFYVENAKNNVRDGSDRWIITAFNNRPGNFSRYNRFAVDIAADSADLLQDIRRIIFRVEDGMGYFDFYHHYQGTFDLTDFINAASANPAEFHTLEVDIREDAPGAGTVGANEVLRRPTRILLLIITGPDDVPGKFYFNNLRFLR